MSHLSFGRKLKSKPPASSIQRVEKSLYKYQISNTPVHYVDVWKWMEIGSNTSLELWMCSQHNFTLDIQLPYRKHEEELSNRAPRRVKDSYLHSLWTRLPKNRVVLPTQRKLAKNTDFHANTGTLLLTLSELYGSHVALHFLMQTEFFITT